MTSRILYRAPNSLMTCMSSCQTGTCTHTMYLCVARNYSFPTCLCRSNQEVVFGVYPVVLFLLCPVGSVVIIFLIYFQVIE